MGNCMTSEEKIKQLPIPAVQPREDTVNTRVNRKQNEIERQPMKSEEERIIENHRRREENERRKQIYNLGKLRETLHEDMETFLLNNILFSVQFFENFDRDRRSFARIRQKEQSRLNAEGPGGGLSSQRHRKRASLPDTMQETVGRWVSLDLSVIKNPQQKMQNPNQKRLFNSNTGSANALNIGKEFLAPLRIMIVHEDVRVVEAEEEGLSRAIIPEPSSKQGYVRLHCVGDWEDESNEIYNVILRDKEKVPEISEDAEESPYPDYTGSERIGSDYSYSSQILYDKYMGQGYSSQENFSSFESEEEEDSLNSTLKPRMKSGVPSISQRPPMKPPKDIATGGFSSQYPEEENTVNFQGKQNGKSKNGLDSLTTNYPRFQKQIPKTADSLSKETDNFKLTTTDGFGNIPKGFHVSPKPSISTENSDSDYGYATIPPSYSPPKSAKRHGGIPLQCLTNVRYRRIEGKDAEEDDVEGNQGEEFARRIEGNITYLDHLFIKKTFLDPSAFLKAFGEEVRWRESHYYSFANTTASEASKISLDVPTSLDGGARRKSKSNRNDSLDKISVKSVAEFEDDSLQAILGIPASVAVEKKGGSWFSQRDRRGMRFPIEMTPSITIPWPDEAKLEWRFRERNRMFKDTRTNERRPAWPIRKVDEARRTLCHAIAPDLTKDPRDGEGYDNLGWKLCFCEAERILEEDLTHTETRCLLFMFLLRKCYLEWDNVGLSHKFVRTVFYWQCERGKINSPEEEMGKNIRTVIKAVYRALSRRKLDDYFMKKRNLADEESITAISRSIAALKRINEVLSIHVARAISTLRFSDSKVPILDFKQLVEILTEENILKMVNPKLFGLVTNNEDDLEDEETERIPEMETPGPSTSVQNDTGKQNQVKKPFRFNPPNINLEAIQGNDEDRDNTQRSAGLLAEFSKIGRSYQINPDKISSVGTDQPSSTKPKTTKVTVIKSTGTLSAKKPNPRPEASDAFARLKKVEKEKADNQQQWMQQLINGLEMVKKTKQEKGNTETKDIFLKAEKYKPEEVAANPERRRLILSLFAKHFAYLGRRCGRDWRAFRVADLYLRHAENLTILLKEHEGYDATYDDQNEEHGEATAIMNDIATEFEILRNLRTKRLHEKLKIADDERLQRVNNGIHKEQKISSSMPELSKKYNKNVNKPLKLKKRLQSSQNHENHVNSSDEDIHF